MEWFLLLHGVYQWRLGFFQPFGLWSFVPPDSSGGGCFPLVFVWAMVVVASLFFLLVFFFWFRHEDLSSSRLVGGETALCCVIDGGSLGRGPSLFLIVWSQIYAFSSIFGRHAPPKSIVRRSPLQLPEAVVVPIVGAWRVTFMRQGALFPGPRVWVTFQYFQAMYGGFWGLGQPICCLGVVDGGACTTRAVVWRELLVPLCFQLGLGVSVCCVCIPFVSPVQSAVVVPLFLWEYLLACC
jgi:hypothetical protein